MAEATLEERVATLEQLVAQLIHTSERTTRKKDWRRMIGMFDGDPIMQEIIEEGRRLHTEEATQAHMAWHERAGALGGGTAARFRCRRIRVIAKE
jgi:hypothetical protein